MGLQDICLWRPNRLLRPRSLPSSEDWLLRPQELSDRPVYRLVTQTAKSWCITVLVDSHFLLYSVIVHQLITPRAHITLSLAYHHESLYQNPKPKTLPPHDSLITASDLLSDLQVKTYSLTEHVEKTKFILEQMQLLLEVTRLKDMESSKAGKGENGTLNS